MVLYRPGGLPGPRLALQSSPAEDAILQTILNQMVFQDHEVDQCQLQLIPVMIRIALLQGVILIEDHSMLLCWNSHINHQQPAYQERYFQKGKLEAETEVFKRIGIANLIGWSIAHQETQLIVLHVVLHTVNVKLAVQILHLFAVVFGTGSRQ